MIKIKINGCSKDKILKECLTKASIYFLGKLLPRKRNIEIVIRIVDNLLTKEIAYGECYNYSTRDRPSNYIIQLEGRMKPYDILSTLAHEMVHIKQFDKKELVFFANYTRWKGERYDDNISYVDYPWEHESEKIEIELSNSFMDINPEFNEFLKNEEGIVLNR